MSCGFALAVSPARADMQVLGSNIAEYPRGMVVKGNTINNLQQGQWVHVLMLEDHTTRLFGNRPPPPIDGGTRDNREDEQSK